MSRRKQGPIAHVAIAFTLLVGLSGCVGDAFYRVSAGDCVSGQPRMEGTLRTIDCSDFDQSNSRHHRIHTVFEDDADAQCPMGTFGVESRNRVVCFTR